MFFGLRESKYGKRMDSVDIHWKKFLENGDEQSFSFIYNHHVDDLFSYGMSLGFQKETCKDALQDIFFKLYTTKEKLHHVENITAYLFKTFKHRLIDLSLKNRSGENIESYSESFTTHVSMLDDMIDRENSVLIRQKVESLLNSLTPNQREVVYLKYMIGLQHREIAEVLGIHEESARKLLYRAMEKLRRYASAEDLPEKLLLLILLSHL
ncbi:MAG: RNA polymerase sigma factor, sigma-70 family [Proteiniphilum acetatigenes]|uniref:RNA polymerase sigma factor, sigma-70 family n=1 Tax=Proteiniphilum acetatigenes TaxID=294710 RepID=A0A101HID2_9BACT|nr:MAG: RNA polymerase sigma factor, sigma-70 family [Proteiniphilum acetatigenes]